MRRIFSFLFLLLIIFSALLLTACLESGEVAKSLSSLATVYINPQISWGPVGQNFTVDVCISDVVDLYGWEFKLSWNATLLNLVNVLEGMFLKSGGPTFFTYKTNNTLGYMIVDCTLLGDTPGVSGDGTLATIEFYVKTVGECILDLYDTILVNSAEEAIAHSVFDGWYCTSVHDIAIIDLKVSSKWVNVTVENQGTHTETFNVSAFYRRLSDPLIGTQTVTLMKGEIIIVNFSWTPPLPGIYEVRAEASKVYGETDLDDNIYTMTIQVEYNSFNLKKQSANNPVGYCLMGLFVFGLIIILQKIAYDAKNLEIREILIFANLERPDRTSIWEVTIKARFLY